MYQNDPIMMSLPDEMNSSEQEKNRSNRYRNRDKAMLKKLIIAIAAFATIMTGAVAPANAFGLGSYSRQGQMRQEQGRAAPLAFQLFCLKYRDQCKSGRGHSTVAYNARVQSILASVNRSVNRSIRPKNDIKGKDVWSLDPRSGDCEDYALTKRSHLMRAGIPASALRIAVVRTRAGEGHAVLFVKTSAGEFVLDNLRSSIVKRQAMPYRLVSISSSNPLRWRNS